MVKKAKKLQRQIEDMGMSKVQHEQRGNKKNRLDQPQQNMSINSKD